MKCEDLGRRLTELRDAALGESDCAAIEGHLQECARCGALHQELEDLARLCRESERPRMPAAVRRRIEEVIGSSGGS
jgi:predicted anti-sigma-YlaC factor YlaD